MAGLSGGPWAGRLVAAAVAAQALAPASALADCYDVLGCTDRDDFGRHMDYLASPAVGPTCDFLWLIRNEIFAQHGYCFRTARGKALEAGPCRTGDAARLGLSPVERRNVAALARAEREKTCPP